MLMGTWIEALGFLNQKQSTLRAAELNITSPIHVQIDLKQPISILCWNNCRTLPGHLPGSQWTRTVNMRTLMFFVVKCNLWCKAEQERSCFVFTPHPQPWPLKSFAFFIRLCIDLNMVSLKKTHNRLKCKSKIRLDEFVETNTNKNHD